MKNLLYTFMLLILFPAKGGEGQFEAINNSLNDTANRLEQLRTTHSVFTTQLYPIVAISDQHNNEPETNLGLADSLNRLQVLLDEKIAVTQEWEKNFDILMKKESTNLFKLTWQTFTFKYLINLRSPYKLKNLEAEAKLPIRKRQYLSFKPTNTEKFIADNLKDAIQYNKIFTTLKIQLEQLNSLPFQDTIHNIQNIESLQGKLFDLSDSHGKLIAWQNLLFAALKRDYCHKQYNKSLRNIARRYKKI